VALRPEDRFDPVAAEYDRARPGYPQHVIAWLCERAGVGPGDSALDLGAGTGLLSRRLVEAGLDVLAAEPNGRMRGVLAERVPAARVLPDPAEELSLGSGEVALATAAQAFHWFEQPRALEEIRRVLRPTGSFAVIWATIGDHSLAERINRVSFDLLEAQGGSAGPVPGEALGWDEHFEPIGRRTFDSGWELPPGMLPAHVGSYSVVANLPELEREELLAEVADWPETTGGATIPFEVEVNLARARD